MEIDGKNNSPTGQELSGDPQASQANGKSTVSVDSAGAGNDVGADALTNQQQPRELAEKKNGK